MASPDTIKANYENASPVVATSQLFSFSPPRTDPPYAHLRRHSGGHLEGRLRLWAVGCQLLSQLFVFDRCRGERLRLSERCDGRRAVCLANEGSADMPQGHVSWMKWRGLAVRLRNSFNMIQKKRGRRRGAGGEKDVSLRVAETDSSLSSRGTIS